MLVGSAIGERTPFGPERGVHDALGSVRSNALNYRRSKISDQGSMLSGPLQFMGPGRSSRHKAEAKLEVTEDMGPEYLLAG